MKRTVISEALKKGLSCDILLLVGGQSAAAKHTRAMLKLFPTGGQPRASMVKIERVGDVLTESPEKVSEAILFFCQVMQLIFNINLQHI